MTWRNSLALVVRAVATTAVLGSRHANGTIVEPASTGAPDARADDYLSPAMTVMTPNPADQSREFTPEEIASIPGATLKGRIVPGLSVHIEDAAISAPNRPAAPHDITTSPEHSMDGRPSHERRG
jgi:hypothetical protein